MLSLAKKIGKEKNILLDEKKLNFNAIIGKPFKVNLKLKTIDGEDLSKSTIDLEPYVI